ncbi:hypothetical protein HYX13_02270 [Candidatus Woesearchaeota archaeon]|nr:hypothetical protein [Candidatus Woesearchaeota archaeon]
MAHEFRLGLTDCGLDDTQCPEEYICEADPESTTGASYCVALPEEVVCGNGVVDAGEDCSSCPLDVQCAAGEVCTDSRCAEPIPSCTDGVQNGDETGVDCGGTSCAACVAQELQLNLLVGFPNFTAHYDGVEWTPFGLGSNSTGGNNLTVIDFWGDSASNIYALGNRLSDSIHYGILPYNFLYHYDGSVWRKDESVSTSFYNRFGWNAYKPTALWGYKK